MRVKKILFSFIFFIPIFAYSDAEVVTKHALMGCSTSSSQYHLSKIKFSLGSFDILTKMVQSNQATQQEAKELWDKTIENVSDDIFKFNKDLQQNISAGSESAKLMFETRAAAQYFAFFQTIIDLAGKEHNETRVNRIFTAACEAKVMELTENFRISQKNRRAEMDQKLDKIERDLQSNSRRADIEISQRLINQGLGIFNQNNSKSVQPSGCFLQRETISGFHKNCHYKCVTGNVTNTIGSAEVCPPTR
jgi:hypothetical protein